MTWYVITKDEPGHIKQIGEEADRATTSKHHAEQLVKTYGGHIVELGEEPKKVKLPKKAAEWIDSVKSMGRNITDIFDDLTMPEEVGDWLYDDDDDDDDEAEHHDERGLMLINAYLYGYTMEKEKKYNVKVPQTQTSYYYKGSDGHVHASDTSGDLDNEFSYSELQQYGLDGERFTKEEVTDDER